MNDLECVDVLEFFAPSCDDAIDGLIATHTRAMNSAREMAEFFTDQEKNITLEFFIRSSGVQTARNAKEIFNFERVKLEIDSVWWSKTLACTDVLNYMPQKRRDEWNTQLSAWREPRYKRGQNPEKDLPEYTEPTVRATVSAMLAMRAQFLAERVDGIFRGLSGEHVTNSPSAFGKRMIIAGVTENGYSASYSKGGLINDLRCVIAKFMGRVEPTYNSSHSLIVSLLGNTGEWVPVDGNSMRIRLYKKGTAHIEIHPDIAWRLNSILAYLYPHAIPAQFRTKPPKKLKEFELMMDILPFVVCEKLGTLEPVYSAVHDPDMPWMKPRQVKVPNALTFRFGGGNDKHVIQAAEQVLLAIGGVKVLGYWMFDYDAQPIIHGVVASGCIPEQRSHQFYPTPETVAHEVIRMAEIGSEDECLEPSAGQGGIADHMPKAQTLCVEISELHCKILESKGFLVHNGDFIEYAKKAKKFDVICMNPPFSQKRAEAHTDAAISLLKKGGRVVSVMPTSKRASYRPAGVDISWSQDFKNEFEGTGVSVVIFKGVKL